MAEQIHVLDYGAGNLRSLINAIRFHGFDPVIVSSPDQLAKINRLVFPGVGTFGAAMKFLSANGYVEPLRAFLRKPGNEYLGICIGMQVLFESSEESPNDEGLGIIPGSIGRFKPGSCSVPNIGWSGIKPGRPSRLWTRSDGSCWDTATSRVYFVHSYRALPTAENASWVASTTEYAGDEFISTVQRDGIMAVQFHPEKSGHVGLDLLKGFLCQHSDQAGAILDVSCPPKSRRIVACLDVRTNDEGDLVVTKGDSYDVREESKDPSTKRGRVRNLGKPVELAKRYYEEGADEVTFLNITSFRSEPLEDAPMLDVLEEASKTIFVPLCIGGGIRDYKDTNGKSYSALNVADRYFRAGADKISIGSDAVIACEELVRSGSPPSGLTSIERISQAYGAQAVVISVDPKRVYCDTVEEEEQALKQGHTVVSVKDFRKPQASAKVWYQCTIKGGREGRNLDVAQLVRTCEQLGAGEILLNSIDCDGQKQGFDLDLVRLVRKACSLPVIASSGAGSTEHFVQVFEATSVEAALAAGIFHRKEVLLHDVKQHLDRTGIPVRL